MAEINEIPVQRITIGHEERLVVRIPFELPEPLVETMQKKLRAFFGTERVIVLPRNVALEIVKAEA